MRSSCFVFAAFLSLGLCRAPAQDPERVDPDFAKKIGALLAQEAAKLKDLPLAITADPDKSMALKAGERAGLIMPDAKLTIDLLKKADTNVVPIGQFFLHGVTLMVGDKSLPAEKLRMFDTEQKKSISLLQLGVARIGGRLVLVVYAGEKVPAIVTTLFDVEDAKDLPLELDVRRSGESHGVVVLTVLGKYRGTFGIAPLE
ncbi:MAG: hypothetical protein U0744_12705 [Gemmataceae bacterium]